jgi:hypothetical protein
VDTVVAFDTEKWETGVSTDGNWIIVEQYPNREKAVIGHKKWIKLMKDNPSRKLKDINVWG